MEEKNISKPPQTSVDSSNVDPSKIDNHDKSINKQLENINAVEFESYGKLGYKRLKRLRKKALNHGITVPELKYKLERPTGPRGLLLAAAIICLVLLASCTGLFIYFATCNKLVSNLIELMNLGSNNLSKEAIAASLGFSSLASAGVAILVVCALLVLIFPIMFLIYFALFTRDTFNLAFSSKQELAKGYMTYLYFYRLAFSAIVMIILNFVFITFINIEASTKQLLTILSIIVLLLSFIAILVLLIIERTKCKKWYNSQLSYEEKSDFEAQNSALLKLRRKSRSSSQKLWE